MSLLLYRSLLLLPAMMMVTLLSGCLGGVIGTLVAPQAVAVSSASRVAGSVAQGMGGTASTVNDLDRILRDNPNAINRGELQELRNHLAQQPGATATTQAERGGRPPHNDIERRRPSPEAVSPSGTAGDRRRGPRGDQVGVEPVRFTGTAALPRREPKPFHQARQRQVEPGVPRFYQVPIQPVRLGPASRRDG